jgi:hypothetical protein
MYSKFSVQNVMKILSETVKFLDTDRWTDLKTPVGVCLQVLFASSHRICCLYIIFLLMVSVNEIEDE